MWLRVTRYLLAPFLGFNSLFTQFACIFHNLERQRRKSFVLIVSIAMASRNFLNCKERIHEVPSDADKLIMNIEKKNL